MKNKIINIALVISLSGLFLRCEDIQTVSPIVTTTPSRLSSNFLLVNASPDAPSLDLYINNLKVGTSVGSASAQSSYFNVPITVNASSNNTIANTDIHVKSTAAAGIGGLLGTKDLIFRSGSTSTNNFQSADGGYYTLVVVDSIKRPAPVRTNNSLGVGDLTYYSTKATFPTKQIANPTVDTVIQLTIGYNSIVTANLIKKYNNNNLPNTFFPIGTVPLGSTDPGGVRFLLISDAIPTIPTVIATPSTTAGKISVRFLNLSPDAELGGAVTCTVNAVAIPAANALPSYPMFRASGLFDPAVGSRFAATTGSAPVTVNFNLNFASTGSYPVAINVAGNPVATTTGDFSASGAYTIILTGLASKGTLAATVMKNF